MKEIPNYLFKFMIIFSVLAPSMEVNLSIPSFPDISDHFDISDSMVQMTIAYNLYGIVLACLFQGPLSDSFGRRKVMIIGNAIMVIGSAACVFAQSIEFLLVARFIQGIGASTAMVVSAAIVTDVYSGKEAAKLLGLLAAVLTIFASAAPILGTFINEFIGWRANYALIALIAGSSWVMLLLKLPETKHDLTDLNFKSITVNYFKIYTNKKFLLAALIPSIGYSCYVSFLAVAAFIYMETFNLHPAEYAIHQTFIVGSFSVISMFTGHFLDKIGEINTVILGVLMCLISAVFISLLPAIHESYPYTITFAMMVFTAGLALSRSVPFARALSCFPRMKGTTSSALTAFRNLTTSLGVSIVSIFHTGEVIVIGAFLSIMSLVMLFVSFGFKSNFQDDIKKESQKIS